VAIDIDFTDLTMVKFRLVGPLTINSITAPVEGHYHLIVEQDAIGDHVITWPSNVIGRPRYELGANSKVFIPFLRDDTGDFVCLESEARSYSGAWTYDNNTAEADPGQGKFRVNALGTELYINDQARNGIDYDNLFNLLQVGDLVGITETDTTWFLFQLTGVPVDNVGWHTFPVNGLDSGGGSLTNNSVVDITFREE